MPLPATDRRRSPRARAEFPIQIGPPQQARPARLKDLSENGLCCISDRAIPEMTAVAIDVQLPGGKDKHQVKGAVVRCARVRSSSPVEYEIAVYFMETTEAAQQALRTYVQGGQPV